MLVIRQHESNNHVPSSLDPGDLKFSSYNYELLEDRIAQTPLETRHAARLLAVPPLGADPHQATHRRCLPNGV